MTEPNIDLGDALIHDAVESRTRFSIKMVAGSFMIGFACAVMWMGGWEEQPLETFGGATSMAAQLAVQPLQMPTTLLTSSKREVMAYGDKKKPRGGAKSISDDVVRNNLAGVSRFQSKKGWKDPQGREGKGYGVYRFSDKYGANIDGYAPIYQPDEWSDTGNTFTPGVPGLIAWFALVVVLLGVGANLIYSTSQLG
jgi:photosystem II protein